MVLIMEVEKMFIRQIIFICIVFILSQFNLFSQFLSSSISYSNINAKYKNNISNTMIDNNSEIYELGFSFNFLKYFSLNLNGGKYSCEFNDAIMELKFTDNYFARINLMSLINLGAQFYLQSDFSYLNSAPKNYLLSGLTIKNFEIKDFLSEVKLKKEFHKANLFIGISYLDSLIKSSANSDLYFRLNNTNNFLFKIGCDYSITERIKLFLDYSYNKNEIFSSGLSYHFITKKEEKIFKKVKETIQSKPVEEKVEKVKIEETVKKEEPKKDEFDVDSLLLEQTNKQIKELPKVEEEKSEQIKLRETLTQDASFEEYLKKARRNLELGRFDEAIKELNIAKNLVPNSVEVYQLLGDVYEKMGNYKLSLEYYDIAIKLLEKSKNNK